MSCGFLVVYFWKKKCKNRLYFSKRYNFFHFQIIFLNDNIDEHWSNTIKTWEITLQPQSVYIFVQLDSCFVVCQIERRFTHKSNEKKPHLHIHISTSLWKCLKFFFLILCISHCKIIIIKQKNNISSIIRSKQMNSIKCVHIISNLVFEHLDGCKHRHWNKRASDFMRCVRARAPLFSVDLVLIIQREISCHEWKSGDRETDRRERASVYKFSMWFKLMQKVN